MDSNLDQCLWKFSKNFYYAEINGIFISSKETLQAFFGNTTTVYFGELAGKNSEVEINFSLDSFELIEASKKLELEDMIQFEIGVNPIERILEDMVDDLALLSEDEIIKYLEEKNLEDTLPYVIEAINNYKNV